jgi:hypothetical protein
MQRLGSHLMRIQGASFSILLNGMNDWLGWPSCGKHSSTNSSDPQFPRPGPQGARSELGSPQANIVPAPEFRLSHDAHERRSRDGRVRKPKPTAGGSANILLFHSKVPESVALIGHLQMAQQMGPRQRSLEPLRAAQSPKAPGSAGRYLPVDLTASIRASTSPGARRCPGAEFGIRTPGRLDCSRIISPPYLEILVCLEYNVARTVARKGGGKPADRRSDCPGVSTCLRGRCYVPLGDSR